MGLNLDLIQREFKATCRLMNGRYTCLEGFTHVLLSQCISSLWLNPPSVSVFLSAALPRMFIDHRLLIMRGDDDRPIRPEPRSRYRLITLGTFIWLMSNRGLWTTFTQSVGTSPVERRFSFQAPGVPPGNMRCLEKASWGPGLHVYLGRYPEVGR